MIALNDHECQLHLIRNKCSVIIGLGNPLLSIGAICPQPIQISKFVHKDLPFPEVTSEDCLFLNVYAPATANRDSRLPVMVWIHGGAFTIGACVCVGGL